MITKDSTLPEVIGGHPATRAVFDRYGLHGCGGALGPNETIEFFSRVHAVPLDTLLAELEAAKDSSAPAPAYAEDLGDVLYRRFFRAAIVVILTAGATLGASLLVLYAIGRSFLSLELFAPVQAHANAQIFGWVGLFVMGFAYQGFPRFKYVRLWRPDIANLSFVLMLAGLVLRAVAPLVPAELLVGTVGGALEAAAIAAFLLVIGRTIASSRTRDPWDKYVYAGLGAYLLAGLAEPVLYGAIFGAPDLKTAINRVATFMGPYRDLQIMGFAGLMILGVSQRILPHAFGFRAPGRLASAGAFWLLAIGLLADIGGWLAFRSTGQARFAVASWIGTSLYAAGALWIALSLAPWRGERDRATKFIRAAYLWLAVACLMMIAEPFYNGAIGVRFSHAYHGAIRHAFTVGFISLMILGVSSKVVPILKGVDARGLSSLWVPFALINVGNALRVGSQLATDLAPAGAFPIMGASGTLEVIGLTVWGLHIWGLMRRSSPAAEPAPAAKPERIEADMTAAKIVDWYPETLEVFAEFGFKELKNPFLRNTLARNVTVRMACGMKNVDQERFLSALNARISRTLAMEATS